MTTPTTTSKLEELAAKVEAATGPDENLDAEIAVATDWRHRSGNVWYLVLPWERPRFTASIDDAMMLVPDGYNFSVDRIAGAGGAVVNRTALAKTATVSDAATPALALCCAALRARSRLTQDAGEE